MSIFELWDLPVSKIDITLILNLKIIQQKKQFLFAFLENKFQLRCKLLKGMLLFIEELFRITTINKEQKKHAFHKNQYIPGFFTDRNRKFTIFTFVQKTLIYIS